MKLTFFLLTVFFLQLHANVMSQTVTFSGRNMSIKEAFAAIKKQTGYSVFAQADLINNARPVTLDARNMPLSGFIDLLLKDQKINYRIVDKSIILSGDTSSVPPFAQQAQALFLLRGIILDARGLPLEGATVRVPDTGTSIWMGPVWPRLWPQVWQVLSVLTFLHLQQRPF